MKLREKIRTAKQALDAHMSEKSIISERRSINRESLNRIVKTVSDLEKEISDATVQTKKLEKSINSDEKQLKKLLDGRDDKGLSLLDKLKDELRDYQVEKSKSAEKIEFIGEQITQLRENIAKSGREKTELTSEIESVKKTVKDIESQLIDLEKEHKSVAGDIEKAVSERSELEQGILDTSTKIGELDHGLQSYAEKLSDYMVEKAKITTRLEDLKREFGKYEGVELLDKSVKDLEILAEKLEGNLLQFGSVNMRAIETYDVIKKEFDEIMEKLDTLKSERQSIFDFMDKIETKKRATFMEAFDKVKSNFERIFAELSAGRGTLVLDAPMNVSESGLYINASPGGKKLMSLDAMSGGEKVLTSSAFLLALQQYKPSAFYIVDELDAALDKRNSVRLAQMLSESESQFFMVTHNNNMLKYMDSAIGVSMVKGVSQIVGVRFTNDLAPEAG